MTLKRNRPSPQLFGRRDFLKTSLAAAAGAYVLGGDWQMFPRDEDAAQMITDGRWRYPPSPVAWKIGPRLAAPLGVRRDARSGLTALVMAPAEDCFAVATPYGHDNHRSLYLSLLGARFEGRPEGLRPRGWSSPGRTPTSRRSICAGRIFAEGVRRTARRWPP